MKNRTLVGILGLGLLAATVVAQITSFFIPPQGEDQQILFNDGNIITGIPNSEVKGSTFVVKFAVVGDSATAVLATGSVFTSSGSAVVQSTSATAAHKVFSVRDNAGVELLGVSQDGSMVLNLGTSSIQDGAVTTPKLAAGAVTSGKIGDGEVTTAKLAAGVVTTSKISPDAVTELALLNGSVTTGKLATDSVITAKLIDGAVTTQKLIAGAVTTSKISPDAVTELSLLNASVTTAKLADGSVTTSKLHSEALDPAGDLTLQASGGNVVIGTLSNGSDATLHVITGSAGTVSPAAGADEAVFESNGTTGISIISPDANFSQLFFGSPSDNAGADFDWNFNNNLMRLRTLNAGASMELHSGDGVVAVTLDSVQKATFAGDAKFDGQVLIQDGTAGNPSIVFTSDDDGTGTGIFRGGTDEIAFVTNGTEQFSIFGNNFRGTITNGPQLVNAAVTNTAPSFIPRRSDTNTGVGSNGPDELSLTSGGVEMMRFDNDTQDVVIINPGGSAIDTRIGASGVVNALFVQGLNGNVGIGCVPGSTSTFHLCGDGSVAGGLQVDGITNHNDDVVIPNTTQLIMGGASGGADAAYDLSFVDNAGTWNLEATSQIHIEDGDSALFLIVDDVNNNASINTANPRVSFSGRPLLIQSSGAGQSTGIGGDGTLFIPGGTLQVQGDATSTIAMIVNAITGQTADIAQWSVNDVDKVVIDKDGNVGIGTTNPATKLHVSSGTFIVDGDTGGIQISTAVLFVTVGTPGDGGRVFMGSDGTDISGDLTPQVGEYLIVGKGTGGTDQRATIRMTGFAGAAPSNNNTTSVGDKLIMRNRSGTKSAIGLTGLNGIWFQGGQTGQPSASTFEFFAMESGAPVSVMNILGNGNVGIGTATPLATLDVAGGIGLQERTQAQIEAITPGRAGIMFACSDCTTTAVCISTGTTISGFSQIQSRSTECD